MSNNSNEWENSQYLVSVGEDIAKAKEKPVVIEIENQQFLFFRGEYRPVTQIDPPFPDTFKAFSLQGLVEFIKTDVDGLFSNPASRSYVRVTDVDLVQILSSAFGYHKKRRTIAECRALVPAIPFDKYMDAEAFQIMVQTRFEESDNSATVLKLSGNLRNEQTLDTADDGFSQRVEIKKGVATIGNVTIKNPVELVPLRTFHEVEQPSSPFVLRFNADSEVALFEGDGGAWKIEAVKNISNWLRWQLAGCNVEIIA